MKETPKPFTVSGLTEQLKTALESRFSRGKDLRHAAQASVREDADAASAVPAQLVSPAFDRVAQFGKTEGFFTAILIDQRRTIRRLFRPVAEHVGKGIKAQALTSR